MIRSEGDHRADALEELIHEGAAGEFTWRGVKLWKNPLDLITYAEIAWEVRPDIVIETGTHEGGSALWWVDVLRRHTDVPYVLTIDIEEPPAGTLLAPHVGYITGLSSTHLEVLEDVQHIIKRDLFKRVLVNLDSDHSYEHVSAELEVYSQFVTPGSYMIVEDGVDDWRRKRRGAHAACLDFLKRHPEFEADKSRESRGLTNCPDGFLRRLSTG